MPISPKVRWLFWMVFSACYATITVVSQKTIKADGSVTVDFVRSLGHPFALVVAGAIAWGLCRMAGFNLRSQAEVPLEVEAGYVAPDSAELRSYEAQTAFRVAMGLFLGFAVLMIPVEIFVRSRNKVPTPFWPFLFGALAIAGVLHLVSRFYRHGKFMARADDEGVEIQDLGQRNKRIYLKWSEISSGVRVENSSVMGGSSLLEFRNVVGKAKAQVVLSLAPAARQRDFVQVVARYLVPSSGS